MKAIQAGLALGVALCATPLVMEAQADDAPPAWAYPVNPPDFKVQPDDGTQRHVPDSTAAFTVTQARDLFFALDWHPSDHPSLPGIVARGRKPDVMACGVCHRADGPGGPENAGIAGLPTQYIVQQMADFKSGARTTSVPQRIPPQLMIKTAKGITDAEIEQAAAYFSGLNPPAVIKVVETATVPKSRVGGWFLAALPGGETEPIAGRIIEVPEDLERFEMRDARSHFIAYVPPDSVEQGRQLANTGGNGKSAPCSICHGPALNGVGPIPGLAGRSPSYLVRQLYDFQHGTRAGPWSPLMAPNVIKLTLDDMVALAAYAASLPP
ncbi:MAG TPA: c-type cytochrome [Stellaceae bacterium]